ncbi:selenide, water dikinase SelD [Suttonella sp. R2A3]|uniref:selenide, water dikinase SelD n=1 Tax=Suttonella sp. R2A3 TaxID=2908648 RepID=UPI0021A5F0C6
MDTDIRLTQYSHGAGCGCKIAPQILETILTSSLNLPQDPNLLVGHASKDDAAAYDLGNGQVILSTTDFFMPIVDDPFDFGRIAATNAISDIYAMGGRPLMAIAILGWPINTLSPEVAQQVIDGGRQVCADAGITLAGGHSIDAPEPIFGLAVTGLVDKAHLQQNTTARVGCKLFLSKPLGVGILSTAQKQGKLAAAHAHIARDSMCRLNDIGAEIAALEGVRAMTDVTGFGLLGHLLELCQGSNVNAELHESAIPILDTVRDYLAQGCIPGGTTRNFAAYGQHITPLDDSQRALYCDPQTSGGLLIAVDPEHAEHVAAQLHAAGLYDKPIGELVTPREDYRIAVMS